MKQAKSGASTKKAKSNDMFAGALSEMSSQNKVRLDLAAKKLAVAASKQAVAAKNQAMNEQKALYDHQAVLDSRLRTLKGERRTLKKQLKTAQNALTQDSDASDIASDLKRINEQILFTETAAYHAMATITAFFEEKQATQSTMAKSGIDRQ